MIMPRIYWILIAVLGINSVMLPVFLYRYVAARDTFVRSEAELAQCKSLQASIRGLQAKVPDEAGKAAKPDYALTAIRRAMSDAEILESAIGDVRTLGTTIIPNSNFVREDSSVALRGIELDALFRFMESYERQGTGIVCSAIDLQTASSANASDSPQLWNVGLTLTCTVKADKSKSDRGRTR